MKTRYGMIEFPQDKRNTGIPMEVKVEIISQRESFGIEEYLVKPVEGKGTRWVRKIELL